MNDMVSMAVSLHVWLIGLMVLIILWMLYLLTKGDGAFEIYSKKYEAISLYHRAILGSLFFTGIVVMAVMKFDVSYAVYAMVLAVLHMLATTIKENIHYKKTHIKDIDSQETFKAYAKKKYTIDLLLLLAITAVAYAVSF